jgi:hypothetical protein
VGQHVLSGNRNTVGCQEQTQQPLDTRLLLLSSIDKLADSCNLAPGLGGCNICMGQSLQRLCELNYPQHPMMAIHSHPQLLDAKCRWDPIKTAKTSFLGTLNMLGLAKRCKVRVRVFSLQPGLKCAALGSTWHEKYSTLRTCNVTWHSMQSACRMQCSGKHQCQHGSCKLLYKCQPNNRLGRQVSPNKQVQCCANRVHLCFSWLQARFLITSTSEVYGDPLQHPQTEAYWGNVNCIGERSCYDEGKPSIAGLQPGACHAAEPGPVLWTDQARRTSSRSTAVKQAAASQQPCVLGHGSSIEPTPGRRWCAAALRPLVIAVSTPAISRLCASTRASYSPEQAEH